MFIPCQHRCVTVFFIAYSVTQAKLTSFNAAEPQDVPTKIFDITKIEPGKDESTFPITPPSEKEVSEAPDNKENKGFVDNNEPYENTHNDVGYEQDSETKAERENWRIPTMRPPRTNCSPPAIEQFPRPLMGRTVRNHGGLILHIVVCVFTFIGLVVVCNGYFILSIYRICKELKLAPDVAGATFLAVGSSAPELTIAIFGVFCAQDDIGVSGVIGSAVFNIMFVISVCALCAGTVSHLNWWPLCRDCFLYAISILVMLWITANNYVSWLEALIMLIMYGVYCVALRFNTTLERAAMTIPLPFKLPTKNDHTVLVTNRRVGDQPPANAAGGEAYSQMEGQTKETPLQDSPYNLDGGDDHKEHTPDRNPNSSWDPNNAIGTV